MNTNEVWDLHYTRDKSRLFYPDENLVRLLSDIEPGSALDLGCGSGRHIQLLLEQGFSPIYGIDYSQEAIKNCKNYFQNREEINLQWLNMEKESEFKLDLETESFTLIVIWGVLHYNPPDIQKQILKEIKRLLKPEGRVLGTLRSDRDTHFRENPDINRASMYFFSEEEARSLLKEFFSSVEMGYMERTPLGDISHRVCHWFFKAGK